MTAVPLPYATADDLAGWLAGGDYADQYTDSAASTRVLQRASETIAWYTAGGYDDTGTVADTVVDALRDATCAQVEQWCEIGEETSIAGWPQDTSVNLGFTVNQLPPDLAPRAGRILVAEGILNARGAAQMGVDGDVDPIVPVAY